ncbi:MAG: helix-turn-helix domain-containing protein [Lachnospiraceae bacterium]
MERSRLRELREGSKLTQESLGEKVNISQQAISRIERDVTSMSLEQLLILSRYFKVTTDYLLGNELSVGKDDRKVTVSVSQENVKFVKVLEDLDPRQKELVWILVEKMWEQGK